MSALIIYLAVGIACFFLARAAWGLTFGCSPITVLTLLLMLLFMWLPPLTLLAAAIWAILYTLEDDGPPKPSRIFNFLRKPIANPCKWRARPLSDKGGAEVSVPTIHSEPCDCPKGQCAHFLDNDERCINRLSGDVRTAECSKCRCSTWHQDGNCLRCADATGAP